MVIALSGVAAIMALGQGYLLVWTLMLFIVSFCLSQGAVIGVYVSEIFPTAVRATVQSIASATHWSMNAIISEVLPFMATQTKALPFVVFAVLALNSVVSGQALLTRD